MLEKKTFFFQFKSIDFYISVSCSKTVVSYDCIATVKLDKSKQSNKLEECWVSFFAILFYSTNAFADNSSTFLNKIRRKE
jgi:hypothetical protein